MKRVTMQRGKILVLVSLLFFGLAGLAEAQEKIVMSNLVSPATGFPRFMTDTARTALLDICLDGVGFCEPDPVVAGNAQSEASGFGLIAPYFRMVGLARPVAPTAVRIRVELFVVATYSGAIADGNQQVTNALFVDLAGMPVDGKYLVRHPYGQTSVQVLGGRTRRTFQSRGRPADNFQNAGLGPVKFILTADPPPAAGHVGVLFKTQRVTGSLLRNFVEIEAPAGADIGGRGQPNIIRINQFTIEGSVR